MASEVTKRMLGESGKCRIKGCSGKVVDDAREKHGPGFQGLCAKCIDSQKEREEKTGRHSQAIRQIRGQESLAKEVVSQILGETRPRPGVGGGERGSWERVSQMHKWTEPETGLGRPPVLRDVEGDPISFERAEPAIPSSDPDYHRNRRLRLRRKEHYAQKRREAQQAAAAGE